MLLRWPMSPQASAPVLPSLPERGRLARELEHEIARLPVACPDELRFSVPAAALLGIGSGARWDLEMGFLALRLGWSAGHVLQRRSLHRQGLSVAAQGLVASAEATCLAVLRGL